PICSRRRSKVTPGTVNQHDKSMKSGTTRANQRFFDPSTFLIELTLLFGLLSLILLSEKNMDANKPSQ
ncbi:hypothetical protein NKW84_18275, partial [Acetobacter senegalensis]|uniref:hypothetical protein n=1 Tax=Acetobacter senegalensis TaxID=446692 RepID=UPI00209F9CBD